MKLFHETEGNTELLKGTYKTDTYVDAFYLFFYFFIQFIIGSKMLNIYLFFQNTWLS